MHIDFTAIRATPIESVIRSYGWENRRQGNSIVLKNCPLPSHTSKELWTFKVGVQENLWRCWSQSCRKGKKEGGDVIDLVCEVDGLQPLEAAKKLAELMGAAPNSIDKRLSTNETPIVNKPLAFVLPFNPEHEMIQARGISVETALSYEAGYYEDKRQGTASMHQRIIFPLHEEGQLVGYIGRATVEGQEPKWKMGAKVKSMLFGLERCDPSQLVVLVESAFGVLWLGQRGIQAASLLGSELTEGQQTALAPFRMVNLALDNDEAGREATEKIAERLKANHAVKRSYFRE